MNGDGLLFTCIVCIVLLVAESSITVLFSYLVAGGVPVLLCILEINNALLSSVDPILSL